MTIEAAFLDLMPSTITVYSNTTRDAYGKRAYAATGTSVRCRIQPSKQVTASSDERGITPKGTIYLYGLSSLSPDDKVVLPDGTEVTITSVATVNDEAGAHHTMLTYG